MIVVPQAFLADPKIQKLLTDGQQGVVYKEAAEVNLNNDRYVSCHFITVVLSGQLKIVTDQGEKILAGKDQLVLIPKGLYMISDIIPSGGKFRALAYFFTDELLGDIQKSWGNNPKVAGMEVKPIKLRCSSVIRLFNDQLIKLYGNHPVNSEKVGAYKIMELLELLCNSEPSGQFKETLLCLSVNGGAKTSIKKFMERNYHKPLRIEDYANLTGRSISTFHRDFKRVFDQSPKKWLIEMRMKKAMDVLRTGPQLTIAEVAYGAGYENLSHFSKVFREYYGVSPKQYSMKEREGLVF